MKNNFVVLIALFVNVVSFAQQSKPTVDALSIAKLFDGHVDSIAYLGSSPIYYADGLKGALLICHGMIDDNVHFRGVVRLSQKLIELGKNNWELAVYPVESNGFIEPSSWTDEYKRIFKFFEQNLIPNNF